MRRERVARLKARPYDYLEGLARRAKRITGVHRAKATVYGSPGAEKAHLRITFEGQDWSPNDELREKIDKLRREFSSAFPEWGISVEWIQHTSTRVRPVVRSVIANGRVIQELDCGHRVNGERLRKKRVCHSCSDDAHNHEKGKWPPPAGLRPGRAAPRCPLTQSRSVRRRFRRALAAQERLARSQPRSRATR